MNESTNFGLKTTGDNDQWRNTLDYHNENMGVIDAVMGNNQNALGIIVDGNKAAVSATTGQYIILRNSTITGKTDGLYTAAKSIPANTAIDGTYLTAVSGGGLNALNGNIEKLIGVGNGVGPFFANKDSGSNILILRLGYNNDSDFLQLVINANDKTIKLNRKVGSGSETTLATWTGT